MPALRSAPVRLVALAVTLALGSHAFAKATLQGSLSLSEGWTDNVLSAPDKPVAGDPAKEGDALWDIRPGLTLTTGTPRAIQRVAYLFSTELYLNHSEADAYTNRLEWNGLFQPNARTTLLLDAAATEGRLSTFNLLTPSAVNQVQATPVDSPTVFDASIQQELSYELTAKFRLIQSLALLSVVPISGGILPATVQVTPIIGIERDWKRDALALTYHIDYTYFSEVDTTITAADGTKKITPLTPVEDQIINTLLVKWRHDLGRQFSSELAAGVTEAIRPSTATGEIWQPAGMAAIHYSHPNAQFGLTYQRRIQPNLFVAQTFLVDQVDFSGGVPLGLRSHLIFSASAGYQYDQVLDVNNGKIGGTVHVILADATLAWIPRPELQVFFRYQLFDQISGNDRDLFLQPSLMRNIFQIGLTATFPGEPAVRVPGHLADRVDRTDQLGIPPEHTPAPKY